MTGFGALLRKELVESWRTRRLPIVVILFAAIGILSAADRALPAGDPQAGRSATS